MNPSDFLTLLWGDKPAGLIQLWTKTNKRSNYLRNPAGANIIARNQPDIYTGVGITATNHGKHQRAKANQIAGIAGLWIDLDVNGGPDNKQGAAPTVDDALDLAHSVLEPTIVINSGYGLHAWWLLDEPWIFTTAEDRDRAAAASAQWYELHRRSCSWTIDGTHDLSRLLRLPGTLNAKGGLQVTVNVHQHNGRRYDQAALLERCAQAGPVLAQVKNLFDTTVTFGGTLTREQFDTLAGKSRFFKRTWDHDRPDHPEWSLSEYDLALCSMAAADGWTDQQLADLISTHRRKHGDTGKGERADYVQRTITKARAVTDNPAPAKTSPFAQPDEVKATLSPEEWADLIVDMLEQPDEGAIPMPFTELNDTLDGGLRPGEVCLVAGYTSHGKSIVVDQIADTAADAGRKVHLYMTEMTAFQRGLRLLARGSGVPFRKLKRRELDKEMWGKVLRQLSGLKYGCSIVSDWTVDQVVKHIRENQWDLAVIDLVHGFHYHDERDLSKTSSALVRAAKGSSIEHRGTAIVAAAHLNDGQMRDARSPKRPRPGLHSIKGSSSLKQDADVVMFVWQEDDENGMPTGQGAVWIAKCRQGELGGVDVALDPVWMKFRPSGADWMREVA